jgi:transcriptional regulator with XRE-family HTH domain
VAATPTPRPVAKALRRLGGDLRRWRELQGLTAQQVAERAGVSRPVVSRVEHGEGTTLENVLRVARALGVLDLLAGAVDPMATDVGRLRADERRPQRVRRRRSELPRGGDPR